MSSNDPAVDAFSSAASPPLAGPDAVLGRRAFLGQVGMATGVALGATFPTNAQAAESPTEAIKRIVAARQIINVHEHVQGEANTETLLREMDSLGIGRTILVGSPWFTLSLYEQAGFTRHDENNAAIVAMARAHPDRFEAWPTVNPLEADKVDKLKALVEQGATGAKLYLGHGYTASRRNTYIFHPIAMDDTRMMGLYEYLAAAHLPVCFHVNPAKPGFMDEFVTVLRRFPDLKVNTPHYMLSSMVHSRLYEMLETFPHLMVDISFGHDDYLRTGLQRISSSTGAFQRLFSTFPERFLFGTDYVVTSLRPHSHDWYAERTQAYLDMLSRPTYTTPLLPGRTLNGLALSPHLIENLLYRNYGAFQRSQPEGTVIARELAWGRLRVPSVNRAPGEALDPPARRRRRRG